MLEMLISSSVLILVLILLRHFLRGRIRARLQYALWLLVLLRLLIPGTVVSSKASVANITEPISVQIREYSAAQVQTVYVPVDLGTNPETGDRMEAIGRSYVEPLDVLRWVWYGGMAAMALWFAAENLLMARRLKTGRKFWGSHESFPVFIVPDIPSPCLFGLFNPTVYLTEQAAADEILSRRVLAHEYTHICHFDMLWSLLRSVCLVVWWFNPLVWWAAALSRRDAELACDEGAIRRLGEEQRFEYGRSLLSLATVKTRPRDLLCGATTMTGGKNSLRERIEGIARTKKLSVSLAVLCVAVAAVAAGCTFTGAQGDAVPTPQPTVTPAIDPDSASNISASPNSGIDADSASNISSSQIIDEALAQSLLGVEGATAAYMLYSIYLDDFMDPDPSRWLTWLRFESDMEKQLSLDNYHPLLSAEILSVEKINDKLFAFTVLAENTTGMPAEKFFNFLVLDPEEGSYVIRNVSQIPEELSGGLDPARYDPALLDGEDRITLGSPDSEQLAIQATLMEFTDPPFVMIGTDENYVSDGTAQWDMSFEDLLFSTDSWKVDTAPPESTVRSAAYIALFNGEGGFVIIDAQKDYISFHPATEYYASYSIPGISGSYYYDSLLAWAQTFPDVSDADSPDRHEQFLAMVFTTDFNRRYSRLQASALDPAAYNEFYEAFETLCDSDYYYSMMLRGEVYEYDRLAIERGYLLTPLSISLGEPIALSETDNRFSFTVEVQVSGDSFGEARGTVSGILETTGGEAYAVTGFTVTESTVLNADPAQDRLLPLES